MKVRKQVFKLSAISLALLPLCAAHAEDGTTGAKAGTQASYGIEEVIVTARKRSESAQETPVVITAISQEQLDRYNVSDMTKIAEMTPQLMISSGSNGNGGTINMRGIGSSSTTSGFDQAVAINIDGIQYSRATVLHQGYFDVGQVEVLKGPQSLFFGKSASAGVISLTSANPGPEREMKFKIGNEFEADEHWVEGVWSGPLSDTVGLRVAARYSEDKGYIKLNSTPTVDGAGLGVPAGSNDHWPKDKKTQARVTLTLKPTPDLDMNFKFNYAKTEGNGYSEGTLLIACYGPGGTAQLNPGQPCGRQFRAFYNPIPPAVAATEPEFKGGALYNNYEAYSSGLNLNYRFNDLTLTSVTGFYRFEDKYTGDYDFTGAPTINASYESPVEKGWSEELRLASDFKGPVNYMLGTYYQDRDFDFTSLSRILALPADFMTGRYVTWKRLSHTKGKAWSVFGQLMWKVTDTVEVSAGARYSDERKDSASTNIYVTPYFQTPFNGLPFNLLRPAGVPLAASTHDTNTSPELTVSWKPTSDMMLYGSLKKGFKSGGFSNSAILSNFTKVSDVTFKPEIAKGFEAGLKSSWLNNTLRVNVAAYSYKFTDLQVNFFDAATINFITQNAATATTRGLEAEVRWLPPIDGLDLHATAAYNKAKYGDFLSYCYGGQSYEDGCNLDKNGHIVGAPGDHQSLSGTVRPFAPEFTASAGFFYKFPVADKWHMSVSGDAAYSDKYLLNPLGRQIYQPSFVRTDASVTFAPANEAWEIALIGRNLGNVFVSYDGGDSPGTGSGTGLHRGSTVLSDQVGVAGRGREVILQFSAKF